MMKNRFRAWNPEEQKMYFPDWITNDEDGLVAGTGWEMWQESHKDHPLMLSTGIKDKNDNEIYEGDIFNLIENGKIISPNNVVELADFLGGHYWQIHHSGSRIYEVIGNKYEMPDLLGRDEK